MAYYLDGVLQEGTPPGFVEKTEEEVAARQVELAAELNRNERNALLAVSDWTQANDSPLAAEKKVEWASYRTALRNLPDHSNWPNLEDDDWPTKPS